jgi:hypothetical protein
MRSLILLLAASAVACSGGNNLFPDTTGDIDGGGHATFRASIGGGSGGAAAAGSGCTVEATNFAYVLSSANVLYSFAPDKKAFKEIGPLGCNTTMQPNSMAIDRNAVAWVNYMDQPSGVGALYKVSTTDGSCIGRVASLTGAWFQVGMGYSVAGPGATTETLYVASTNTGMLGSVDAAGNIHGIGTFGGNLAGQSAELTGTGDGRLFGFFTTSPVIVVQVDKASGTAASPQALGAVETPNDWAFSFWGGKFYLYTWAPGQASTNVNEYDPTSGAVDPSYMRDIGFDIVGAGVSTCAPTFPAPQ